MAARWLMIDECWLPLVSCRPPAADGKLLVLDAVGGDWSLLVAVNGRLLGIARRCHPLLFIVLVGCY